MAEYGQDPEMVELYQTVNRIMNMGDRSLSTSARRGASDSEAQVRPVAPLRGGGGAVLGANGLDGIWDAIGSPGNIGAVSENIGAVSPGQDMVMQQLIHAKSELQRSKQQVAKLQAQLQADKLAMSPSVLSSPSDERGHPGQDLEQALSCVSSASPEKALDSGATDTMLAGGGFGADLGKSIKSFALSPPSFQAKDSSPQKTRDVMRRPTLDSDAIWNEAVSLSPAQVFHAKSKRGLAVPVEFVPSPDGDEAVDALDGGTAIEERQDGPSAVRPEVAGAAELAGNEREPSAAGVAVDAPKLMGDLQDLAHEFPSCAKYLMGELDSRRQVVLALPPPVGAATLLVCVRLPCGSAARFFDSHARFRVPWPPFECVSVRCQVADKGRTHPHGGEDASRDAAGGESLPQARYQSDGPVHPREARGLGQGNALAAGRQNFARSRRAAARRCCCHTHAQPVQVPHDPRHALPVRRSTA